MSAAEAPGGSAARAHLSQLVEMFGADGCLRIRTDPDPDAAGGTEQEDDGQT
ncbi:hypothetical protein ABZ454_02165 [Streptomyces sp. NPDC005803]|uniref:hypothetical protein n=1 Tax=Streptomyces sp. NPDC005803 TaxID=3154297 RepID=UPI0033EE2292